MKEKSEQKKDNGKKMGEKNENNRRKQRTDQ